MTTNEINEFKNWLFHFIQCNNDRNYFGNFIVKIIKLIAILLFLYEIHFEN